MYEDEPTPEDEFEGCPDCGHDDLETWVETVEVGPPLNRNSRGNVAPKYRTKKARFFFCPNCKWGRP